MSEFSDQDKSLEHIEMLKEAPPETVSGLEAACEWIEYETNQTIIDRDDDSTEVFFIAAGEVKVMDFLANDQEIALAELGAGMSFGELSAVDNSKRSARVTAIAPTLVGRLAATDFRKMLIQCPGISLMLLKRFAGVIRTLNTRITALSTLSPHQRVYYELLRMAEPQTSGDGTWIIHYLPKHDEIASWSGTTREEVAMAIGHLARESIVGRKHKSLIIKDHSRLQMLLNL